MRTTLVAVSQLRILSFLLFRRLKQQVICRLSQLLFHLANCQKVRATIFYIPFSCATSTLASGNMVEEYVLN
jgi:hypothetical protein